ncbi:MAG: acyl carrier protein [Ignavibacteriales bacterium]|nr:acyl carrier protein [Ignavibacteriales bacterium]
MDNLKKYNEIFMEILKIDENQLNEDLKIRSVSTWDSIGHMSLITAIEDKFDIFLETEDILGFSSYIKGIEMLKKYEVDF